MPDPEFNFALPVERLIRKASRRLPRTHRAEHEGTWRGELAGMQTLEEQLAYMQDIWANIGDLCQALDPEMAYVSQVLKVTLSGSVVCLLLSFQGIAPAFLQLLAFTLAAGMIVLMFSHLTTKCLLVMREVRRVWWRLVLNLALTVFCAYAALMGLVGWSVLHPQVSLLMVLAVVMGVRTARRFHQPRPALVR
jgi:hypothetical protein